VNDPAVFVPTLLGLSFLTVGILNYRRDLLSATSSGVFSLAFIGPVFIAASLAAFAGEHFTAAASLAGLVPKWMPARLFITYFVGVAHLAAALSLVAKKCIRWSAIGLAIMFALFVLTLYLPSAVKHPAIRMVWVFPVREGTFAMGGVALFATVVRDQWPLISNRLGGVVRIWTALALIFFGIQNVLYPQFAPGVPSNVPTSPWVPFPRAIAYVVGALLIVFGGAALVRKCSGFAISSAGLLMALLTLGLFAPDFFLARNVSEQVQAINFIFDTLLFGGTLFVIANAQMSSNIALTASIPVATH
jgi:uncharacterized membrane protein